MTARTPVAHPPAPPPPADAHPHRWRALVLIGIAELLGMGVWFSASAASPRLQELWALSPSQAGWLTGVVQLGFVAGTAVAALLNLADLLTGETSGTLSNFLHFEVSGSNTILHISSTGGFSADSHNVGGAYTSGSEHQSIVFQNTNLVGAFTTDAQVISDLLTKNKLVTD